MKINKKKILKITIISAVLMAIYALTNKSYGLLLSALGVIGLGTIFLYAVQVLAVAIGLLGQGLITGLTAVASGSGTAVSGLKAIFFNHSTFTTASYFASDNNRLGLPDDGGVWTSGIMMDISAKVTQYYVVLRNLAIAILLFVLLYIAIRMAISTVASEEAKYQKMLKDWVVSLALVFVLHYIMVITFFVSNTLVSILESTLQGNTTLDYTALVGEALIPFTGAGDAIIFLMLIGMELTFLFMYIKRVIVLGFLILIAPLITITYSIDKIGDGKSQALNNWLKEFIYNVIIQPFHCILYITLIDMVIKNMSGIEGFGGFIIYIIVLQFVKEAEEIIKRIFNIQAQSMPGMKNMGTMALGAMIAFGGLAKAKGTTGKAKKMPKMTGEAGGSGSAAGATAAGAGASAGGGISAATPPAGGSSATPPAGGSSATPPAGDSGIVPPRRPDIGDLSGGGDSGTPPTGGSPTTQPSGDSATQPAADKRQARKDEFSNGFTGLAKLIGGVDTTVGTREPKTFVGKKLGKAGEYISKYGVEPLTSGNGLKNAAKAASVVAFAGMGLGMGDSKSALGLGMTAYGVSNAIDGAIQDSRNMQQLDVNEQAYNSQYEEYVEQMKALHPRRSEDEIRKELVGMFEQYDDDLIDWDNLEMTKEEKDLKRHFLEGAYSQLRESYEITGGEKPTDLVKSHTSKKSAVQYRNNHPNS